MSVPNEKKTEVLGRTLDTDIYWSLNKEIVFFPFSIIFSLNYVVFIDVCTFWVLYACAADSLKK